MCDKILDGKRVRVDFSITRGPHAKTPGIYYGAPRYGSSRAPPRRSPSPRRRSPDRRY